VTNTLGQDAELDMLRALAPSLISKSFVDVGAEKGSVARALFDCGLSGVLFEPLARHLTDLQELVRERTGAVYPWAIAEGDGTREFFIATDPQGNELDHFHSLERATGQSVFDHKKSSRVVCRSLGSLVAEGVLARDIGILKIDTEGGDLAVLRGLGVMSPELIVCEFFTDGLYEGWSDAAPERVIEYLRERGYQRFVAFKRTKRLETCVAGPCGFQPRQWGNLFFFSDDLFIRVSQKLETLLASFEKRLVEYVEHVSADREAKEQVIQQLLAKSAATVEARREVKQPTKMEIPQRALPACLVSAYALIPRAHGERIALDVGAHHGAFSIALVSELALNRVFVFEPYGPNVERLRERTASLRNISIVESAVGDYVGVTSFCVDDNDATGSVLRYAQRSNAAKSSSMPITTLNEFCESLDAGCSVALIKIDTQGYDLAVLRGASQVITKHRPLIYVEFIYAKLYDGQAAPSEIEAWLRERGYILFGLCNIHVGNGDVLAFCDAVFVPLEFQPSCDPPYRQIDNEQSYIEQIDVLNRACAERLAAIELLDREVKRLRKLQEATLG
jgi:FkbM family methyltransferase